MALENIERIRANIEGVTFTTDIMVGFPGETEEDFLDTVDFVKKARFLDAHVFAYSKRKNTPAATYKNQVPEEIKRKRSAELISVVKEVRHSVLTDILNSERPLSCIFEEKRGDAWYGHSECFAEVLVKSEEDLHGEKRTVIPEALENDILISKLI